MLMMKSGDSLRFLMSSICSQIFRHSSDMHGRQLSTYPVSQHIQYIIKCAHSGAFNNILLCNHCCSYKHCLYHKWLNKLWVAWLTVVLHIWWVKFGEYELEHYVFWYASPLRQDIQELKWSDRLYGKNIMHKRDNNMFYTHLFAFLCFIFDMCVEQICVCNTGKDDKYLNWCAYEWHVGTETKEYRNCTYHQSKYTSRTLQFSWPR